MTNTLRGGAILAIVVGSAVVWILAETVQRAQDSNALVVHSEEVLGAADKMLSVIVVAGAAAASLDDARATLREMRGEENRLLRERGRDNQIAVQRLQRVSVALGTAAAGFGAWIFQLNTRRTRRVRQHAEELGRANERLETEIGMQSTNLISANARLQSVIDSAVDGIIVIDARGQIESFNHGAERLFDHAEADVIGRNVNMLMPEPYHREHDADLARHMASAVQKIIGTGGEVAGLRRDGSTFPLHLSVGKMTVGGEEKFTGIVHDLSARVAIEVQLREQAALARIGEMAAVIAHEVKNPLAGIRGAVQVIGSRLPADNPHAAIIGEIVTRIDTLNELMKDLLLFARPPQPHPTPLDPGRLIDATTQLFSLDPTVKDIQVRVTGTAPAIVADGELLKIVFVNLLVNAGHAMQGRGTIDVSLGAGNDTCLISFKDHGPGMPAEIREKIFVPFFTTKARGSGLGLSTAKRLIDAHRGRIEVDCPPGGGTIVTVELPAQYANARTS